MAMDSAVETVPVESSTAEAAATPTAAPAAVTDGQGNNVKMVKCRRCAASLAQPDTLVTQKFREDLRYTCRPCHAVQTQLQRHGVDLKTVLSEEDVATFFLDAKAERDNTLDKRLCYAQARGILKKRMVESSMKVDREGEEAEYQPLSFWELKGYNTQRIQEQCEDKKEHPLLGTCYAVNISKKSSEHVQQVVEERLLTFESLAKQKVLAASSANAPRPAPVPLTSNMGIDVQVTNQKRKRSEMTEEEKVAAKEAAKAEREETKKRQKAETLASSAAAKLLPKLKATAERLNTAVGKLSQCTVTLPDASAEQVKEEQEALQKAVANCTKLLATVSKGGAVDLSAEDLTEATEKSLNQRLKSANDAVRTAQAHVKSNKENAPASAKSRAKAKKQWMVSDVFAFLNAGLLCNHEWVASVYAAPVFCETQELVYGGEEICATQRFKTRNRCRKTNWTQFASAHYES